MSLRRMLSVLLVSAVALCAPSLLSAQSQDAPKVEVFGGYSWYHPGGTVDDSKVPELKKGWAGQVTYNVNRWAGIALDVNGHYSDFGNAHSLAVGPQFKFRTEEFTPFAEALFGVQFFDPQHFPNQTAAAIIAGGGLEYKFTSRLSIRPIQADYVHSYYNQLSSATGLSNSFDGFRLQAGLLFKFGLPAPEGEVTAACSAAPQAIDAGAPVEIAVTPSGFLPKRSLTYSYASTGGKVSGNAATASLDSTGLEPGSYTVSAKVTDNGTGKHQRMASCQATFTVNAKHPPTLAVSANPDSLNAGDSSTITANGSSPDNRPLTYRCTSSAGHLSGNGPIYTLDTTGVPDSTIAVNCTVTDDRNLSATADASVKVNVPAPPPPAAAAPVVEAPQPSKFGDIEFKRDLKRPTRVDNEAKGELDRYADALAAAPDSKGVVVGYATEKEEKTKLGSKFAAERAVNTKEYLTKEKGIDPARIETRTGSGDDQRSDLWIVPAGAQFPEQDTVRVDESHVKAVPRVAPTAKRTHQKAKKAD
jgi:outer membrane protein OmpA-like peptidoglycan-associated protein